jgi:hypothetical protein
VEDELLGNDAGQRWPCCWATMTARHGSERGQCPAASPPLPRPRHYWRAAAAGATAAAAIISTRLQQRRWLVAGQLQPLVWVRAVVAFVLGCIAGIGLGPSICHSLSAPRPALAAGSQAARQRRRRGAAEEGGGGGEDAEAAAEEEEALAWEARQRRLREALVRRGACIHASFSTCRLPGVGGAVVTATPVRAGEVLVEVPLPLCLCSAAPEGGAPGDGSAGIRLTRALLHHLALGDASPHAAYIRSLPPPGTLDEPAFWEPGSPELSALGGSRLGASIAVARRYAQRAAARLAAELHHAGGGGGGGGGAAVPVDERTVTWAAAVQVGADQ